MRCFNQLSGRVISQIMYGLPDMQIAQNCSTGLSESFGRIDTYHDLTSFPSPIVGIDIDEPNATNDSGDYIVVSDSALLASPYVEVSYQVGSSTRLNYMKIDVYAKVGASITYSHEWGQFSPSNTTKKFTLSSGRGVFAGSLLPSGYAKMWQVGMGYMTSDGYLRDMVIFVFVVGSQMSVGWRTVNHEYVNEGFDAWMLPSSDMVVTQNRHDEAYDPGLHSPMPENTYIVNPWIVRIDDRSGSFYFVGNSTQITVERSGNYINA